MTETEAKWSERVRGWRASGQTAEQFAQGRGFEASTLRYWASRLGGKHSALGPTGGAAAQPARDAARVRLVRVRRTSGEAASAPLVIALGAARIEVRRGFDPALLGDVVEALGGGR